MWGGESSERRWQMSRRVNREESMQAHVETRATCWCLHYIERCVRAMLKYVKNKARLTQCSIFTGIIPGF